MLSISKLLDIKLQSIARAEMVRAKGKKEAKSMIAKMNAKLNAEADAKINAQTQTKNFNKLLQESLKELSEAKAVEYKANGEANELIFQANDEINRCKFVGFNDLKSMGNSRHYGDEGIRYKLLDELEVEKLQDRMEELEKDNIACNKFMTNLVFGALGLVVLLFISYVIYVKHF